MFTAPRPGKSPRLRPSKVDSRQYVPMMLERKLSVQNLVHFGRRRVRNSRGSSSATTVQVRTPTEKAGPCAFLIELLMIPTPTSRQFVWPMRAVWRSPSVAISMPNLPQLIWTTFGYSRARITWREQCTLRSLESDVRSRSLQTRRSSRSCCRALSSAPTISFCTAGIRITFKGPRALRAGRRFRFRRIVSRKR
jgi:hypothetical protein